MTPHDQLEQLSAYLDGELEASERTALEAHLPSCAECRTTLDALRATVADLAALPEPAPSEQDSWALRSAIARARTPARRWQRFAWAAGGVAAAVVAFVAFTQYNGGGGDASTAALRAGDAAEGAGSVPIYTSGQNFDALSAQAHLLSVSGKIPTGSAGIPQTNESTGIAVAPMSKNGRDTFGQLDAASAPGTQLDRCVATVQRSTQELLTPFRYDVVTFESKPAFFLIFSTTDRFEMWVVSRDRCDVLFFTQAK